MAPFQKLAWPCGTPWWQPLTPPVHPMPPENSYRELDTRDGPADFEKHIRNTARNIGNFAKNLKIELCPADFDLLAERQCLSEEQFTFVKNDGFDRGEFEIRADRSSYKQSILEH